MSDSILHYRLVERLILWASVNYPDWKGNPVITSADHVQTHEGRRPPKIGDAIPDLYITSVPIQFCLIGEAKTTYDLETVHSQNQLSQFLRYLRHQDDPWLVLATPWNLINTARNLMRVLAQREEASCVNLAFIQDIGAIHPCKCLK